MIDDFSGKHRFLSNFYPCQVVLDDELYSSVEHAYVAAKTIDLAVRELVRACPTPGQVKRLGRKLALRPDWETVKLGVMEELVRQKFTDPTLKALLLATGDAELVEGNHWGDTFWGVCNGHGTNHLGRILMRVRAELNTAAAA